MLTGQSARPRFWIRAGAVLIASVASIGSARAARVPFETTLRAIDPAKVTARVPGFARVLEAAADEQLVRVVAYDIDNDNDLDVVASDGTLDLLVWENDGAGHLTRKPAARPADR